MSIFRRMRRSTTICGSGGQWRVYQVAEIYPGLHGTYCGTVPPSLVYPFRAGIAPRLGLALRLPKSTVVRAGYGINFNNGQYLPLRNRWFVSLRLPMCKRIHFRRRLSRWRMDFRCRNRVRRRIIRLSRTTTLPYVQAWNIDVQKTFGAGDFAECWLQRIEGNASGCYERADTMQYLTGV
jgi:hypothetical protein